MSVYYNYYISVNCVILFFQPQLELSRIKNEDLLPTKAEIMAYIEQYENARIKIQDTRKCIYHPENILVYINIYVLILKHRYTFYKLILFLIIFSLLLIHQLIGSHFCLKNKLTLLLL